MNLTSNRRWFCAVMLGCLILLSFYQWDFTGSALHVDIMSDYTSMNNDVQNGMKYILLWTNPDTGPLVYWGPGQHEYVNRKCKINNCYVTANRSLLPSTSQFDAVVFGSMDMWKYIPGPTERSPHQKYIFVSLESSRYYPICDQRYDGYFNWTWTYRLDSDEPYGYITIRNITGDIIGPKQIMHWMEVDSMKPINERTKNKLKKKNKTAAWFVSNCKSLSKREQFVDKLQTELDNYGLEIDIFGVCEASKQCPRSKMKECLKLIQEEYYFYLSLENSFGEDYVTEKLLTALQNYAVPIVFGGANYTRYYSFFKWRNHYTYHYREESPDSDDQCIMCEMLHDENLMQTKTVYTNFREWWNPPEECSYTEDTSTR
ncbi:alpha-(1,3)-fucosyltransferase C-like isoform X2 [Leguminivora glycinivorella]|uniref:alpha-(1,3)-fucosyltransferase C-like isoform X2 n=1 Tax=Leguminivora glycinivorella TaxID=1035111 RepID=UPI00200EDE58|nr:alpha-(1,3)-fucosyltransferase C-like isoform X2 [Leguminivora glycinivorella]